MKDKMVSAVCIGLQHTKNPVIIMVQDITGLKNYKWGIPGGRVEERENPAIAIMRELKEEVGGVETFGPFMFQKYFAKIKRTGEKGEYEQIVYSVHDTGAELKETGVPNEVGPPKRLPLWKIVKGEGEIEVYQSHLYAIFLIAKQMAKEYKEMAFVTTALARRLKIEI
jgi:8-oxo-dGTP pyrophosphatase MutT (NUDIX family)